jgi:hypothetical protein
MINICGKHMGEKGNLSVKPFRKLFRNLFWALVSSKM